MNEYHHHFIGERCVICQPSQKYYPKVNKEGNLVVPESIWKELNWIDKFKLMFIGAMKGKFIVKK